MKNFLIWSFTVLMTVVAGTSYFVPELVNLVAAFGVFMIILATLCSLLLYIMYVAYDEENPNPVLVEAYKKLQDAPPSLLKRCIVNLNKLVITVVLIYHGWVFTGVVLGIVLFVTYLQFKSICKMELPKLEN